MWIVVYIVLLINWYNFMDDHINILLDLMRFDTSHYCINKVQFDLCAEYIASIFSIIGFNVELIDTTNGKLIVGKKIQSNKFPHIHFNGHYDVVTPNIDFPVTYDRDINIISGRGCSDMKGGIISIWLSLKEAIKSNIKCNYSFSFSPDEETGGQVATAQLLDYLITFLPRNTLVVIADSSFPQVISSHRGAFWINVKISMKSSERFSSGVPSALEILCKYYKNFIETPNGIEEPVLGGLCHTSETVNMWPHTISFSIDYRFDSAYEINKIKKWVSEYFTTLNQKIKSDLLLTHLPLSWESVLEVPPCEYCKNLDTFIRDIREVVPQASLGYGKGFYDLRWFRKLGYDSSFVFGPGDIRNSHASNEQLPVKNLIACSKVYIQLIVGVANEKYTRNGETKV